MTLPEDPRSRSPGRGGAGLHFVPHHSALLIRSRFIFALSWVACFYRRRAVRWQLTGLGTASRVEGTPRQKCSPLGSKLAISREPCIPSIKSLGGNRSAGRVLPGGACPLASHTRAAVPCVQGHCVPRVSTTREARKPHPLHQTSSPTSWAVTGRTRQLSRPRVCGLGK